MLNFYQLFKARHLISRIESNGKKFRFMILFLPYAVFFPITLKFHINNLFNYVIEN